MKQANIPGIRLYQQQLTAAAFTTPKALVSWMGAMQAHDYAMSKWAVGLRVPESTLATVNAALDKGQKSMENSWVYRRNCNTKFTATEELPILAHT